MDQELKTDHKIESNLMRRGLCNKMLSIWKTHQLAWKIWWTKFPPVNSWTNETFLKLMLPGDEKCFTYVNIVQKHSWSKHEASEILVEKVLRNRQYLLCIWWYYQIVDLDFYWSKTIKISQQRGSAFHQDIWRLHTRSFVIRQKLRFNAPTKFLLSTNFSRVEK